MKKETKSDIIALAIAFVISYTGYIIMGISDYCDDNGESFLEVFWETLLVGLTSPLPMIWTGYPFVIYLIIRFCINRFSH
ncbi:MAG: hypothetical protein LBH98_06220 [Chitinispirillales bacterium]|jgi:hypothetical protein|nr:hypothetical protein [Chitinispirillales bacterium]